MTSGFLSLRLTISITCAMSPYLLKLFLKVVKTFPPKYRHIENRMNVTSEKKFDSGFKDGKNSREERKMMRKRETNKNENGRKKEIAAA